jgi:exosome complex protein LRP1
MDPQTDLPDLVEDLEVNIDELTSALTPLLNTPLSTPASSLPLLDKAKLYVLAAYSIESLLYSTLQASGVNAKEHAIFKELGRLKGYFGKIKSVEERSQAAAVPKSRLDVGAANRFIKHGLAGNERYDLERAERVAKERARAHLKAQQINKKFDDDGVAAPKATTPKKRDVDEMEVEESLDHGEEVLQGLEEPAVEQPATKRQRVSVAAEPMDVDSAPSPAPSQSHSEGKKKSKKHGKKTKTKVSEAHVEEEAEPEEHSEEVAPEDSQPEPTSTTKPSKKKRDKKKAEAADVDIEPADADPSPPTKKTRSKKSTTASEPSEEAQEAAVPVRAPKTRSETFNALLDGALPEKPKRGRGRPPKGK